MASYQIPAPAPMSMTGDLVNNWKQFRLSWEYFVLATELSSKDDPIQAAALCAIMGPDCVKIMNVIGLTADEKKVAKTILDKLGGHFMPKRHVLLERSRFLDCVQGPHETIDSFLVRLRQCAETCEYGDLEEGLIRDKLCKSTQDKRSGTKLINERPVADLNRCIEVLRAAEMTRQYNEHDTTSSDSGVHAMKSFKKSHSHSKPSYTQKRDFQKNANLKECEYCGYKH